MKDKLLEIINFYEINNQQRKLAEEIFELQESITTYENTTKLKDQYLIDNISKELADCLVLLKQIQYYYEIPDDRVKEIMRYKINRQLERIGK